MGTERKRYRTMMMVVNRTIIPNRTIMANGTIMANRMIITNRTMRMIVVRTKVTGSNGIEGAGRSISMIPHWNG